MLRDANMQVPNGWHGGTGTRWLQRPARFAWAPASATCQGKSSNDTQRRFGRRVYPVYDLGGAEAIYTIRTCLVQACPGIQVPNGLIAVHTKNVLVHASTYEVHTSMYPVHTSSYQVRTKYIL